MKPYFNNFRNKLDEQILALAGKGGAIGATFYPIDVTDYLVELVGIKHVALGSARAPKYPHTQKDRK